MFKRSIDILVAATGLIALAPLMLILMFLIRVKLGSPVFFRQTRPGLGGRPFLMVKFRTMTDARNTDGSLRPDAERLTAFGRFLRSSSLDELPELWNVLKGEMSIVGPRPLLMEYLPLYNAQQMRRHEVRPGITGWAQINGRNAISWEEKFDLDVWYIDNQSLALDFKIFCATFLKIIGRHDISQPGEATMSAFRGSPSQGSEGAVGVTRVLGQHRNGEAN